VKTKQYKNRPGLHTFAATNHKTRSKGGAGAHTVHIQMNKNGTGPGVQRLKRGHPLAQNPRPADRRDAGARRGAPSIAL